MAFCPECQQVMGSLEPKCPHCGYDFAPDEVVPLIARPEDGPSVRRTGFAYSKFADLLLIAGTVVAGFACLGALFGSLAALSRGERVNGLVVGPMAAILFAGLLVVFVRTGA